MIANYYHADSKNLWAAVMRSLVSGIVGIIVGSLVSIGFIVRGGPQGSGPQLVGEYCALIMGILFLGCGVAYLILGINETVKSKKRAKKKRSVKRTKATEEYLTFTCSSCQSLFRTRSTHTGRRVKCPTCKASIKVPGEKVPLVQEDDDEIEFHRSKGENVPVWFIVAGGIVVLVVTAGFVTWMVFGEPEKKSSKDIMRLPQNHPFNNPNFKMPPGPEDFRQPPFGQTPGGPTGPGGMPRFPR